MRLGVTVGLFCLCATHVAQAQRVRGTVTLPDSVTPATGIIVVATDSLQRVAGRTLSGERGDYTLALPAGGVVVLRALRVGYRPTVLPPITVATGEVVEQRIVLSAEAVNLAKVTVQSQSVCRIREDSGQMVAQLWEEARKALTAAQLAVNERRLTTTWLTYVRTLDSAGRAVRKQTVAARSANTSRPFVSDSPASLDQLGYVINVGSDIVFRAPDERALLSDQFASAHCFSIVLPSSGPLDRIGVGFRPSASRNNVKDIEGTFWLDRATAELRSLDFSYTGLAPEYADAGTGGRVEFRRISTGHWFVNRWSIRMPQMTVRSSPAFRGTRPASYMIPVAMQHSGGEVSEVSFGGAVLYAGGGALFELRLMQRDSSLAVAGTTIALEGSDRTLTADSTGRVRLAHVLEGRYTLKWSTAVMREADISQFERLVDIREGMPVDTVSLPTGEELLARACGAPKGRGTSRAGLLYGTVTDETGAPIGGALVTLSWLASIDARADGRVAVKSLGAEVTADAAGRWRVCGVPRERVVQLYAAPAAAGGTHSPTVRAQLLPPQLLLRVPLTVHRAP